MPRPRVMSNSNFFGCPTKKKTSEETAIARDNRITDFRRPDERATFEYARHNAVTPIDFFEYEKHRASGAKYFALPRDDMHRAFVGFVKFLIPHRRRNDVTRRLKRYGFDKVMCVAPSDPDSRASSKASQAVINHQMVGRRKARIIS